MRIKTESDQNTESANRSAFVHVIVLLYTEESVVKCSFQTRTRNLYIKKS